ncbi:DUF6320 domain-containing protein [Garciella nitratireducens]|uniref:DUF6320 domain-containing protein n=1 Tax=Garciella nitratireducens TaxID=218205 RepID=UPI001BD4113B|nr:DUF6320 domain-containing protein [Garciella nitratireducens]
MQYCNHCKVQIRGNQRKCPLCNSLLIKGNNEQAIFPKIPPFYKKHLAMKIMIFVSITAIIGSFAIYRMIPAHVNWPILVLFGLLSMWISLLVTIKNRYHISKNILWQVAIVSILSIFWDWKTGWAGWSLNYVIPTVSVSAMFVMYVIAKIMKLSTRDYILSLFSDALLGIIPIVFLLFNWVDIIYPSIICATISIIFIAAILIFQGENIKSELSKKMHL